MARKNETSMTSNRKTSDDPMRRLIGRHYRVTWRWVDPKSPRHGDLVESNYYGPIGSARDFWKQYYPRSPVVRV